MWIAIWNNESGDSGVEGYWEQEPSDTELYSYFREFSPDDFGEHDGQYIFWVLKELKEISNGN
jgi:hypothetical protein